MRVRLSLFLKFIYALGDEELQDILFRTGTKDFHEDPQLCHFGQGIRASTRHRHGLVKRRVSENDTHVSVNCSLIGWISFIRFDFSLNCQLCIVQMHTIIVSEAFVYFSGGRRETSFFFLIQFLAFN